MFAIEHGEVYMSEDVVQSLPNIDVYYSVCSLILT